MLQFEELRLRLEGMQPEIKELAGSIGLAQLERESAVAALIQEAVDRESVSLSWNADRISGETVTMRKMPTAF